MEFPTSKHGSADFTARKTETGVRFAYFAFYQVRHAFSWNRSQLFIILEVSVAQKITATNTPIPDAIILHVSFIVIAFINVLVPTITKIIQIANPNFSFFIS